MEIFAFILAAAALIWGIRNRSESRRLSDQQQHLFKHIHRVNKNIEQIQFELEKIRASGQKVEPQPPPVEVKFEPPPAPVVEQVLQAPVQPEIPPLPEPETAQAETIPTEPVPPPIEALPPPPRPAQPAAKPLSSPKPKRSFDWEALIGVKLFSWIAGIALTFAAIFFLKYSVDHGWLSAPIRMAIGLLTGTALLVVCEWKAARRFAVTANALDAAGIAILFSTFFAAHAIWNLLGVTSTFGLMALVTAVAVLLSLRHDSSFIAVLGLVGGFATPILLSTGEDRPIGLFSYLLLLNLGLDWVAYRKRWAYLTALSAVFTTIYQWGWVMKFLGSGNLPLAAGIFLVFPILSFSAFALGERRQSEDRNQEIFRQITMVSVAIPHVFAIYLAAVPAYGDHLWLLFGFLFLLDIGLAAIAISQREEVLHAASAVSTVLVFGVWLQTSYHSNAWPGVLGIVSVFLLFYLGVPHVAGKLGRPFTNLGKRAVFAAPLLLLVFPVLAVIEPATAAPFWLFFTLFLLMAAIAARAIICEEGALHFLAAFFALAAEAIWSSKHLDPEHLLSALSIYAIFGLFYLGVPALARR